MRVMLDILEGARKGDSFTFDRHGTFVVERSSSAGVCLAVDDRTLSRHHFLIEINPPLCRLVDLQSRNCTELNGEKVRQADLKEGDVVRAGKTRVGVRIETESYSGTLQVSDFVPALPKVDFAYELLEELGRGAMGVVYRARHKSTGDVVALKMILPRHNARSAAAKVVFMREARILCRLRHPHIIKFRDLGVDNDKLFFVVDYVPGCDAARFRINSGDRFTAPVAVALICQVLKALAYAHGQGFVHRDIKPSNVLVTKLARGVMAKLADFGLARMYNSSSLSGLTLTGHFGGTAGFMPPEQILNYREVLPVSDQYGAAATLYSLLTGKLTHDFPSDIAGTLGLIVNERAAPIRDRRKDLPSMLAKAIDRALANDPKDRWPDVEAFRRALLPFAGARTA